MKKPDVALWDKDYKAKMREWVVWHVENTTVDNLEEFMREFMKMSRGQMNPQIIKEIWKGKEYLK